MSKSYDNYLENHISNVKKAFDWMVDHDILDFLSDDEIESYTKIIYNHDRSKYSEEEYEAYDQWFYPDEIEGDKPLFSDRNERFNRAWLHHIHENPHHWQHWILVQDNGLVVTLYMPRVYTIEMICDWWSFSWKKGDLKEIFSWVEENSNNILLNPRTKIEVDEILAKIGEKLDEEADDVQE